MQMRQKPQTNLGQANEDPNHDLSNRSIAGIGLDSLALSASTSLGLLQPALSQPRGVPTVSVPDFKNNVTGT